jgi:membrane fusion protein, multidrug efflux system
MDNPNAPNKVSTLTTQEPGQTKNGPGGSQPGQLKPSQVNVTTTSLPREEPPPPPAEKDKWATRSHEEPPKRSSLKVVIIVLVLVACVAGLFMWRSSKQKAQAQAAAQAAAAKRAVPVSATAAVQEDMPVYLEGLGSVSAFYTVTVKSRVDGQLVDVPVKEGQDVKKGDLLAVIDPRPYEVALSQAQAALTRDQAQTSDAKLNLDRDAGLVHEGVIPQQQYDTQHALVDQLNGTLKADQAQIDNAQLNVTYAHITSPITGRVGLRLVDPGNIVHAADANGLFVITQLQPIAVIFTLPEDNLQAVLQRMRNKDLDVDAFTRDDVTDLAKGKLETIDNEIDQTTGTFKLKAVFNNENRTLWPDQFVNARMQLDTKKNAIIIPTSAIQTGSQGTFVYVISPQDKTAHVKNIKVGLTQGNVSQVDSGVSAGDQLVVDGQDKLQDGTLVDAKETPSPSLTPTPPPTTGSPIGRGAPTGTAANAPNAKTPSRGISPGNLPPVPASRAANPPPQSSKQRRP